MVAQNLFPRVFARQYYPEYGHQDLGRHPGSQGTRVFGRYPGFSMPHPYSMSTLTSCTFARFHNVCHAIHFIGLGTYSSRSWQGNYTGLLLGSKCRPTSYCFSPFTLSLRCSWHTKRFSTDLCTVVRILGAPECPAEHKQMASADYLLGCPPLPLTHVTCTLETALPA